MVVQVRHQASRAARAPYLGGDGRGGVEPAPRASASELPGLFHSDEDPKALAEKVVHDQCATAIHMLAHDDPEIPAAVAKVFTMTVCRAAPPAAPTVLRRFEWLWQGLSFDIAVLRGGNAAFYLQFIDRQGEEPLTPARSPPWARSMTVSIFSSISRSRSGSNEFNDPRALPLIHE